MSLSLVLACLWVVAASIAGMLPSRRSHWPAAWALIATGLPILGFVAWQEGPVWAAVVLAAGLSILRWPVRYLLAWLRRQVSAGAD